MEPLSTGTQARIADVAARAGVGVATVSRVLNGHANVRPATRDRVLDAIRTLNYRPSSVARNLSLQRTMVIGALLPWFTNPSAVQRVRGIVDGLSGSAYDLMVFDIESEDRQRRAFELFDRGDRADGLLVVSTNPPDMEVERINAAGLPCVLVDAVHASLPSIAVDDVAGGEMATRHLIELGHRRIALIGDPPPEFRFDWSRDRTRGYEQALSRAGIEVRPEYVREGTRLLHVARGIAAELLALPDRPTAVFAASDTQAIGAIEAARARGIRVPEELSVIGFDDIEVASYVGLTTVRQPLFESGRRGAELLLRALSGRQVDVRTELLPLELVVRSTTGPVPI
ncbi:MAG TPA: LacI family DNA-binding transcriptional regulator [Gaiellaceae bacterium]|jgi:DNA-binding LacI/PurR family transcriptional regulator|nr:LacI family DNA-binding transcriptional regulator [Gaiellaceae bacterium]